MAKTLEEVKAALLTKALQTPCGEYVVEDAEGNVAAHSAKPFRHTFDQGATWVDAKKAAVTRYRSANGGYYTETDLPEHDDQFCTERYTNEVKAERNARIADTDEYVQLTDMTVQKAAKAKRVALTDEDRAVILTYREALRDLPEVTGFPFVEYPEFPACIAYECEQKAEARQRRAPFYGGWL